MAEIIKVYRQEINPVRFIGKKYGDADRVNGGFGMQWKEWFDNGWFDLLENLVNKETAKTCPDGDAFLGFMRWKENEPFEYWIGLFMPPETKAPDGFGYIDLPAASLGIGWMYGKEDELYGKEPLCAQKLGEADMPIVNDKDGACRFFERYQCPRFTTPDEKGNVILDIGFYIEYR